jgi:hypothetical protein
VRVLGDENYFEERVMPNLQRVNAGRSYGFRSLCAH